MIKVCAIGDSHLSAFKYGIDTSPPEFDVTVFACRNDYAADLVLRGNSLVARSSELESQLAQFSGGKTRIDFDSYDQFVVIGFNFGIVPVGFVYRRYFCDSMPGAADGRYLLSDDCFTAVCRNDLENTECLRIALAIRSVTRKPISVVASPNIAEGCTEDELPKWLPPFHLAEQRGDATILARVLRGACADLAARNNLAVIPPLKEVAVSGVFNHQKFSLLSDGVEASSLEDKIGKLFHGNSLYGSILVQHIFDAIRINT